ncbi:MAG: hypothetical protein BM556_14430 [Bacteriovorax sp. MedPE-SWde]|nr:MAG: hypothetical protein BM556_14430 [Bacteriovorax sp. MedPE-SWde]
MRKVLIYTFLLSLLFLAGVSFVFYGATDWLVYSLFVSTFISWLYIFFKSGRNRASDEIERAILDSAKVSIIATDINGVITHFSKGAEDLLGYKSYELVGNETPAILHDVDEVIERTKVLNEEFGESNSPGFITFVRKVYSESKDENEWTYIRKDQSRLPVILSVTPIYSNKGTIVGFLGIATDISSMRRQNEELISAKNMALKANRSKSFFLANMSHELRTPLNGIIGMSDLLKDTDLSIEQKDLNQYIHDSSQQLGAIINDILDFSKIEVGGIEINKAPVNLKSFNASLDRIILSLNKTKNIKSSFIMEGEVPGGLVLDETRLTQVLTNLLSNAFKFTKEGSVILKCGYSEGNLIYQIEDTGIGIDQDKVSHLFSAFTQESEHMRREFEGTGLGLSIVRELLQLMGGAISVKSKKGIGSVFTASIPCEEIQDLNFEEEITEDIQLTGVKVLLVEDNLINQKLIVKTLEKVGAIVDVSLDGRDAVEKVRGGSYQLVLMDYQLPIMDGVTATKLIREFNNEIPIVALTANAFKEDKRECLLAGMNEFLAKPVTPGNLKKMIQKMI